MNHNLTAEDILRAVYRRQTKAGPGLNYDISARTSNRSREELNNKTIEELNNTSRSSEDVTGVQSPLTSAASPQETPSQKAFGSNITPARTTSRYTGITVQHCRPAVDAKRPGIKLAVSLQTAGMAKQGHLFLLTAELKRYQRLREIKSKLDDSSAFAQLLEQAKQQIHADKDYNMVMGRLHLRGQRSAWIPNCLAIGRIDNNKITQMILFLDDEEYTIPLDQALTQAQQPMYVSAGQWGTIAHPHSHSASLTALIQAKFGGAV